MEKKYNGQYTKNDHFVQRGTDARTNTPTGVYESAWTKVGTRTYIETRGEESFFNSIINNGGTIKKINKRKNI